MNRTRSFAIRGIVAVVTVAALMSVGPLSRAERGKGTEDSFLKEINPVPLPDPKIPNYRFPEDEATIIGWTKAGNQKAIYLHGWGLWTSVGSAGAARLRDMDGSSADRVGSFGWCQGSIEAEANSARSHCAWSVPSRQIDGIACYW